MAIRMESKAWSRSWIRNHWIFLKLEDWRFHKFSDIDFAAGTSYICYLSLLPSPWSSIFVTYHFFATYSVFYPFHLLARNRIKWFPSKISKLLTLLASSWVFRLLLVFAKSPRILFMDLFIWSFFTLILLIKNSYKILVILKNPREKSLIRKNNNKYWPLQGHMAA